jgi:hypothetical protein
METPYSWSLHDLGGTSKYYVAGLGTVTATWTVSGLSISTSTHGITTTVAIKLPDEIEISTEGTVHTPTVLAPKPLPVKLNVTTTLTFRPPTPPGKSTPEPARKHVPEPARKPKPSLYDVKPSPPLIALPGVLGVIQKAINRSPIGRAIGDAGGGE